MEEIERLLVRQSVDVNDNDPGSVALSSVVTRVSAALTSALWNQLEGWEIQIESLCANSPPPLYLTWKQHYLGERSGRIGTGVQRRSELRWNSSVKQVVIAMLIIPDSGRLFNISHQKTGVSKQEGWVSSYQLFRIRSWQWNHLDSNINKLRPFV